MGEEHLNEVIKRSDAIGDQIRKMSGEFDKVVGEFKEYCTEIGTSYEELMEYAKENVPTGDERKEAEEFLDTRLKDVLGLEEEEVSIEPRKKKKTGKGLRRGKMTI